MLIADHIREHGTEATAELLRAQPAFAAVNLCWHAPADILAAFTALGIDTVEEAQAFALAVHNAMGDRHAAFAALARPTVPLDLDTLPAVQWPQIHAEIHAAGLLAPDNDLDINNGDAAYLMPTDGQWAALAHKFPGKHRKHTGTSERHDCDDFTKEFLGWLASLGYGNLAAGRCSFRMFAGAQFLAGHAVVLVRASDTGLKFIEPNGGKLLPITHKAFAGYFYCNRIQIAELIF